MTEHEDMCIIDYDDLSEQENDTNEELEQSEKIMVSISMPRLPHTTTTDVYVVCIPKMTNCFINHEKGSRICRLCHRSYLSLWGLPICKSCVPKIYANKHYPHQSIYSKLQYPGPVLISSRQYIRDPQIKNANY